MTLRCPVHVIPNGVPIDTTPRRPAGGRLVIGTSARINPQKRLDLLLDAIRRAHPSLPPYVLRVAGGVERGCDDHAALLRQRAEGLPVEWLGGLDDVAEFLRDLDIFVLVAEPAGCPNASLEAMAAGLPVVATDVGGMAEQVEDGVTGRLVGREDVEGLAAAVVEAASDRDRRRGLGRGRQTAGRRAVRAGANDRRVPPSVLGRSRETVRVKTVAATQRPATTRLTSETSVVVNGSMPGPRSLSPRPT